MIFVDSNIPMYLMGADHPHKRECAAVLERLVTEQQRLVTSVEVLQEIMHRYVAIQRKDAIQPAFDVLLELVDDVWAVTADDIEAAKHLVLSYQSLSARDALHAGQMQRRQVTTILSFDRGFDRIPGLERLPMA